MQINFMNTTINPIKKVGLILILIGVTLNPWIIGFLGVDNKITEFTDFFIILGFQLTTIGLGFYFILQNRQLTLKKVYFMLCMVVCILLFLEISMQFLVLSSKWSSKIITHF